MINHAPEPDRLLKNSLFSSLLIANLHRRRQQALTAGGADRIAKRHGNIPL